MQQRIPVQVVRRHPGGRLPEGPDAEAGGALLPESGEDRVRVGGARPGGEHLRAAADRARAARAVPAAQRRAGGRAGEYIKRS